MQSQLVHTTLCCGRSPCCAVGGRGIVRIWNFHRPCSTVDAHWRCSTVGLSHSRFVIAEAPQKGNKGSRETGSMAVAAETGSIREVEKLDQLCSGSHFCSGSMNCNGWNPCSGIQSLQRIPLLAADWSLAAELAFAKHLCSSLLQSKFSCESVFAAGPDSAKSV